MSSVALITAGVSAAAAVAGTAMQAMKSSGGGSAAGQRESAQDTYQAAVRRNQQLEMQAEEIKMQAVQRRGVAKLTDDQAHLQQHQAHMIRREADLRDTSALMTDRAAEAVRERADNTGAVAQRVAIESKRKAANAAGRAKAVMGASGGGVDTNILASILGEGEYAADVALYEGDAKARDLKTEASFLDYDADLTRYGAEITRYNAEVADYGVTLTRHGAENTRYQASLDDRSADHIKWYGGQVMQQGSADAQALYRAAGRNQGTDWVGAGISGLSIAAKYAPYFMGGSGSIPSPGADAPSRIGGQAREFYTGGGVRDYGDYGRDPGPANLPDGMVA